jgi:hypothetical protein
MVPVTSNACVGAVLPIPILPVDNIVIRVALLVLKVRLKALVVPTKLVEVALLLPFNCHWAFETMLCKQIITDDSKM